MPPYIYAQPGKKGKLMRRRTFEEMITYFNQTVSGMDIDRKYKMTLLGMVTALLQKHDEDVTEIVRCKDCKYNSNTCGNYVNCDIIPQMFGRAVDNFCSRAERRTDGSD